MPEKLKLLVVDDNEEFSKSVADNLELEGYEVITAHDGFKALDLVKRNNFSLVLMDVKMPAMDGVETFKKVKQIAPDIPVIMVTAFAVEDLIREALREGAFGTLSKPLDFDDLVELIARATTANGTMILVADDDENLCNSMKDVLEDGGYRVSVACDGNTAVEMTGKNNFDIILIDLKMPSLNGLETYLAIRDIRPDVVAIIITGHAKDMDDMVQEVIQKNAYTCLEKPINMDTLISMLERIKEQKDKGTLEKPD